MSETLQKAAEITAAKVVNVGPTDVIVIECDQEIDSEYADYIRANAEILWPNNKVVVVNGTVTIVHEADQELRQVIREETVRAIEANYRNVHSTIRNALGIQK